MPALFFLHGNSQDSSAFIHQLDGEVGRDYRVVAMDLPGHGNSSRSDHPEETYSPSGYVALILEVVRQLNLGPTVFVGHSLGGHLLIQASDALPSLCGLLTFGTPPLQLPLRFDQAFLPHPAAALLFQETLSEQEVAQWAEAQICRQLPHVTHGIREAMRHTDPLCRSALGRSIWRDRWLDECVVLQSLPVPVAIVLGEHDPFVNHAYCEALPLPGLWGGGVRILNGCGHSPQLEDPERFDALLMAFIRSCAI
ncbi:MAG: alpha/beta hydrolase [Magnetococcus sp. YQC-9]